MNATRYKATFRPQAWIHDYAVPVDPEGPVSWDCTAYVSALPEHVRASVLVGSNYDSDDVRTDPAAPAWVREWSGPFEVDVEALN